MGILVYANGGSSVEFDDRFLAHFQLVFIAKQRRAEPLVLSWAEEAAKGSKRHTVWFPPGCVVEFIFFGSKGPTINREWLDQIMQQANSAQGVTVGTEPPHQD